MTASRSDNPILVPEADWELDGLLCAVTAVREPDGNALRLYYLIRFSDSPTENLLCVARSEDGRTWERPDLGSGDNVVMRSSGLTTEWGTFMPKRIIHEPTDELAPWKMIYWERPSEDAPVGICLASSADGLEWQPMSDRPLIDSANDAASFTCAHPNHAKPIRNGSYLLYQQTWKYNPALPVDRDNLERLHRRISLWYSPEFSMRTMSRGWVGPITILEPDAEDPPDLQHYWLTPFLTSSGYGGLLNCHHTTDQTMDVQYVTSRDGWEWKHELDRQPIVPLGGRGSFDCGMTFCICPPVKWKGETLLYYNGRATVHDAALRYPDEPLPEPDNGIGLAISEDLDLLD